jgi:uncharacterized protein YqeY
MTFEEALRSRINSTKFGSAERNLLKVVLGDVQLAAARGRINDETCFGIVKKLIKGNEESLGHMSPDDTRRNQYLEENKVLQTLLPRYLTVEEIKNRLTQDSMIDSLKSAKSEGQAVGVAMSHLKKANLVIEGDTVKAAVQLLRL